ncbi:hydroxyisourate hydrolase [Planomonospora corallina]|uniref:Hydroxyisourate hydrolase n=1 Tax=Planomonospora corallina TaxID=1806052 RepID=A0ABV8I1S8_9ACTN
MGIAMQALDGMYGRPAAGVRARVERIEADRRGAEVRGETDRDGGVLTWQAIDFDSGLYRIVLETDSYFAGLGHYAVYPEVAVVVRIQRPSDTYRVQVTLSPYSYSTYFSSID